MCGIKGEGRCNRFAVEMLNRVGSQGSRKAATLGFEAQPLWGRKTTVLERMSQVYDYRFNGFEWPHRSRLKTLKTVAEQGVLCHRAKATV